ncbi:helix-turn-helix domain-containing protein [Aquitalea sp. ASV11]|uniref:helix-turn-helix domain-containing protein n=1 Tax=Aquitalea sp. ASV11 TaxID=2795103 RepID=UPI0018ED697A
MTVTMLAVHCGVSRQAVYGWLRGVQPKPDKAWLLSEVLAVLGSDTEQEERERLLAELQAVGEQLSTRWLRMLVNMASVLEKG